MGNLPCGQKAVLITTMILLVSAILIPFTLPKIVDFIGNLSGEISESDQAPLEKTNKPQEAPLKCEFTPTKSILLDEKRFMYCQVLQKVNASMAKEICERSNARSVLYHVVLYRLSYLKFKRHSSHARLSRVSLAVL